jgi:hypothetical protein
MISYTDTSEKTNEVSASTSTLEEFSAGLHVEFEMLITAIGFNFDLGVGVAQSLEIGTSVTQSQSTSRSRSFALGDADDGDYFDVQVCQ